MTEISEEERQRRIKATKENPWYKLALEGKGFWNSFIIKAYLEAVQKGISRTNYQVEINPILDDDTYETTKTDLGFSERHIEKYPDFTDGYLTDSSLNFRGFLFPSAKFQNCIFDIDFHAEGEFFLNGVGFNNAEFRGDATFNNCYFDEANFCFAKFLQDSFFESTKFYGITEFNKISHRSQLLFKNVISNDDITFQSTKFQRAIFDDCNFLKSADFSFTEFKFIRMRDTTITKDIRFNFSRFTGVSQFNKTKFEGFADFNEARFSNFKLDNFTDPKILWGNNLTVGENLLSPSFIGADFKLGASFIKSTFESPPHFEGAKCEIILLDNTTFKNPKKPNKDHLHLYASAWAALIRLMEKVHNLPKRQEFHERLLEIERQYHTEKWSKPLYVAYELFGSGRSALKPVYWLFCLGSYFAFYYFQFYNRTFESALKLSFANTLPFLTFSKDFYPKSETTPIDFGLLTVMTTQNFVSIILLFMFGLALRNRFKLK